MESHEQLGPAPTNLSPHTEGEPTEKEPFVPAVKWIERRVTGRDRGRGAAMAPPEGGTQGGEGGGVMCLPGEAAVPDTAYDPALELATVEHALVGTCEDMCPEAEREQRVVQVHKAPC